MAKIQYSALMDDLAAALCLDDFHEMCWGAWQARLGDVEA